MAKPETSDVHYHFHIDLASLERKVDEVLVLLSEIVTLEETQVADLSALQAEVTENGDVIDSATALLAGLSQQLKDALAANDPAAIQALVDELDSNTASLAASVAANTEAPDEA